MFSRSVIDHGKGLIVTLNVRQPLDCIVASFFTRHWQVSHKTNRVVNVKCGTRGFFNRIKCHWTRSKNGSLICSVSIYCSLIWTWRCKKKRKWINWISIKPWSSYCCGLQLVEMAWALKGHYLETIYMKRKRKQNLFVVPQTSWSY